MSRKQYIEAAVRRQPSFIGIAARVLAVWWLGIALLLWGCAGPAAEQIELVPRSFTYGVALPYPTHIPVHESDSSAVGTQAVNSVPIEMVVGLDGRPDSIRAADAADAGVVRTYESYLKRLRFEPGVRDTVRMAMRLPVVMRIGAVGTAPEFAFPVERNRAIRHMDLYYQAIEWLGYELPRLTYFPSYQFPPELLDTFSIYPTELIRLDLDDQGRPTAVRSMLSSFPGLSNQLKSAANWAEYEPLRYRGQAQATTAYLLVSFFAGIGCPTEPLHLNGDQPSALKERMRVRLLPDSVGLMSMPLPRRAWEPDLQTDVPDSVGNFLFSIDFAIDPSGKIVTFDVNPCKNTYLGHRTEVWFAKRVVARLVSYYPALGFDGRPQPFDAFALVERTAEDTVRVSADWVVGRRLRVDN